ncbi:disease resistance protein At4g27190-like [Syzygium oleosum]|uniref:disease resistance protein At4g27190-like n=1 Tax=Syzygium oleosum TaxID=219896 RepID=UPI0024B9B3AB|nr:disease resistance protein At4g27190-like [Syzygium oleosum]
MEIVASLVSSLVVEGGKFVYRSISAKMRSCWHGETIGDATDSHIKVAEHIPCPSIRDHTTASQTMARILKSLHDDKVRRIGIWGMGGVGKSYLVKNLNNKLSSTLSSRQPFSLVIWATVSKTTSSQELNLKNLQNKIANRLNLKEEETMERTAIQLLERLRRENFLLILDDVWEAINLDLVGIPRPENHLGSKILLTSRSFHVCRAMMTDVEVKVEVLTDEEAWELFKEHAGEVADSQSIKPLAGTVCKGCGKLPLALITVGSAMRRKTQVGLWEDAIDELRRPRPSIHDIEPNLYSSLKLSYDSLQNEQLKSCFLYCCLYPDDYSILISELVECWWAEGLIDDQLNYHTALNKGTALIESLKDSCLLETGDSDNSVKMHGVVRDVAIWIATCAGPESKFLIRANAGMIRLSEVKLQRNLERFSFTRSNIEALPDQEIECSKMRSIFLQYNFLQNIPENFLRGFSALKIMNLGGTQIRSLPVSLLHLQDLRALLLRSCNHLEELPPLGSLTKLSILDLHDTSIKQLPEGMDQLTNLRKLDLSYTLNLEFVLAETVSKLNSLEFLDMTESGYRWLIKQRPPLSYFEIYFQERHMEQRATLEDLQSLQRLSVLYLCLHDTVKAFEECSVYWIERLKTFRCSMGLTNLVHDIPRPLEKDLSGDSIEWFISHATSLAFYNRCNLHVILENVVINRVDCFTNMKTLTLKDAMLNEGSNAQFDLLPNLEELYFDNIGKIKSISVLADRLGLSFPRLEALVVTGCDELENLFYLGGRITSLPKLSKIKVEACVHLNELFQHVPGSGKEYAAVPNLRAARLSGLPQLQCLCRRGESWQSLEQLEVVRCPSLKMLPFRTMNGNSIKQIRGDKLWWSKVHWDTDAIKLYFDAYFREVLDLQANLRR